MVRMGKGLVSIVLGASLVAAFAGGAAGHGDHDHEHDEGVAPVCVLIEADDSREDWDAESLTAGLADGSVVIVDVDPEDCYGVEPAGEPPSAEAAAAWQTITASVFADQLAWEEFVIDGGIGMSEEELQAQQATLREYVATLEATGSHPCYGELHGVLLESASTMDTAITDLMAGESTRGWIQLDEAFEGVLDYWDAVDAGICES